MSNRDASNRVMAEDVNVVSKGQAPENRVFTLAAQNARLAGERDMQFANDVLRSEYQKRLQDVGALRSRAQLTAQNLRTERAVIVRLRSDLSQLLHEFEATVDVNLQWIRVQDKSFPTTSSLTQTDATRSVSDALDVSVRDLRGALVSIVKAMQMVNQQVNEIDSALSSLDEDILIKSGTMMLDRAMMENLVSFSGTTAATMSEKADDLALSSSKVPPVLLPPRSPRGPSLRQDRISPRMVTTPRAPVPPSPSYNPLLSDNTSMNGSQGSLGRGTDRQFQRDWHSRAQHVMMQGAHVAQKCLPLRRTVTSLIQNIRDSGRLQRNPGVIDALQQQTKRGEHLGRQIELNAKALQGHSFQLGKQRAAMEASLEKLDEQLQGVQQRLRMSTVRPQTEQTPNNVEETLRVEETKLLRMQRELQIKLRELLASEKTTSKLLEDLSVQTKSNNKTLSFTRECLDVKLPNIFSSSPRTPMGR